MNDENGLLAEILVSSIVAIASAVLTIFGFWRKAKAELEQEYLKRFNEKKWEIYTKFTKALQVLMVFDGSHVGNRELETHLVSQFVMIASDDVLHAMREWRLTGTSFGYSADETREKLYSLLVEMRNDLGIKYSRMGADDLLEVLIPGAKKH